MDVSATWLAVTSRISKFARVYTYDRAGMGRSSIAKDPNTGEPIRQTGRAISSQLLELLDNAGVRPPYVLVGYSYGGVLMAHLLSVLQNPTRDVYGMVFIDSPAGYIVPPLDAYMAMLGEQGAAEYASIVGTDVAKYKDVLTAEQHKEIEQDLAGSNPSPEEAVLAQGTIDAVERIGVYERRPPALGEQARVSVLQGGLLEDLQRVYAYGLKHGNGTEEQREVFGKFVSVTAGSLQEKYKRHLLLTSGPSRLVKAEEGCTHMMSMTVPDAMAEEIRWVCEPLLQQA